MNREEMLTKLAMEMDSWPTIQAERVGLQFRYDLCDRLVVPLDRAWDEVITERDWLQRRAELINKPSWDDAPDWAKWLAQDADGDWLWYEVEVRRYDEEWIEKLGQRGRLNEAGSGNIPAGHDWRDTLEERPDLSSLEGVTTTLGAALGFDEERADAIGQNGPTGDHYMTPEEEEIPAEEKHTCHRCGGSWWSPMNSECPCRSGRAGGLKFDAEKPRMELLIQGMPRALEAVGAVLTHGAQKYEAHGWQHVEDNHNRYWAAKSRHELARAKGEERDPETGLLHLAHEACNALFLLELALIEENDGA